MDKVHKDKDCVIGKSFEYWRTLYDKAIVEKEATNLRLAHLNHAFERGFITDEEYNKHRARIADQVDRHCPSDTDNYRPNTLIDFGIMLKIQSTKSKQDACNPLKEKNYGVVLQENEENRKLKSNEELDSDNDLNKKPKKSRKRRRRGRKNKKNYDAEVIEQNNYCASNSDSAIPIDAPKVPVKIFVRPSIKKCESEIVEEERSTVTKNKAVRELFSKILKQLKEENKLKQ